MLSKGSFALQEIFQHRGGSAGYRFLKPDEVVIELANEIDKDRLLDVAVAFDHRFVGGDNPERVVGVKFRRLYT